MWETILKIASVYFFSMLKFILGPVTGLLSGLNLFTTVLATVAGMMTVVVFFTFSGSWIRKKYIHGHGKFSIKNQRFLNLWKKYGLVGVAVLTPVILTPIGGSILAVSSGSSKDKIIFYMFVSAAVWSLLLTGAIYIFGKDILPSIF